MEQRYLHPLESNVSAEMATFNEVLNEHFSTETALIDDSFESSPATFPYTQRLTDLLFDNPSNEAWQTTYRALHFAVMLNGLAGIDAKGISIRDDLNDSASGESLRRDLTFKGQEYLAVNDAMCELTQEFMPHIDTTGNYAHQAFTVVALISLQIERGHHDVVASQVVDEWNGMIES